MRPQRICVRPRGCGAFVIKKLKLYDDECCDQLLLSDEPNSAYIGNRDTFHGMSEKSFYEVKWHCCKYLHSS